MTSCEIYFTHFSAYYDENKDIHITKDISLMVSYSRLLMVIVNSLFGREGALITTITTTTLFS